MTYCQLNFPSGLVCFETHVPMILQTLQKLLSGGVCFFSCSLHFLHIMPRHASLKWKRKPTKVNKDNSKSNATQSSAVWKPKSTKVIKVRAERFRSNSDEKESNKSQSSTKNDCNPSSVWKLKSDLTKERINNFTEFFKSKSHTKQEMENAPIWIEQTLTKLSQVDRLNLLNPSPSDSTAFPSKKNFCALSNCIFNIVKTYKFAKRIEYQKFLMNQWILIIKILTKYNANFLQCIHCKSHLSVYSQYFHCTKRVDSSMLHNTPLKQLCVFFRQDLKIPNNSDIDIHERIDNVHECLYSLLRYILKTYGIRLPLLRLQLSTLPMGMTPPHCQYSHTMHVYHTCLPSFPSYKILYNLLSIDGVVPFTFIHTPNKGKTVEEINDDMLNNKFLANYYGSFLDDIPKNWIVALLFTYQQLMSETICNGIEKCIDDEIHKDIVHVIFEFACNNQYDQYFDKLDEQRFLSNYKNVHDAIKMMKHHNMDKIQEEKKKENTSKTVPFKHRTTTKVVDSWIEAFDNPFFEHYSMRPCILNEDEMKIRRKEDVAKLNVTIYNNNVKEERFKFDGLIELLSLSYPHKWVIICGNIENVDKMAKDIRVINSNEDDDDNKNKLGDLTKMEYGTYPPPQLNYVRCLIGTSMQHRSGWRNGDMAGLILYDLPLNIDEFINEISGYKLIVTLTNEEEQGKLKLYHDSYGVNVKQILPENIKDLPFIKKESHSLNV